MRASKQRLSILDVARQASVSPATASRVLSGSRYPVRASTRERVLAAAAELDFQPNLLARALVTARTFTLGAIVHDIADPYFGELVRGLEDAARLRGYQVFVCSSDRDADRELEYVQGLLARRVDGMIFAGGGIQDAAYATQLRLILDRFRERGGAVVALSPHGYPGYSVRPNNRDGALQMTRYLLELGHRRIAFINGPGHLRTSTVRLGGHRKALEEAGVVYDPSLTERGGFTIDGGAAATAAVLERSPGATAFFAANDLMAIGVLAELRTRGVAVPSEISVAGFDDIEIARHANPPLSTVRLPLYRIGHSGATLAMDHLAGEAVRSITLPAELVVRGSTAGPRVPRGGQE